MTDFIQQNSVLFVAVFGAICALIIVLRIVSSRKKKECKADALVNDGSLTELVFDCPVIAPSPAGGTLGNPAASVYVLYAVNGEVPQVFGHSILVSPGEVTLDYEFYLRKVGRKRIATSFGRKEYTLTVAAGKKYALEFDYMANTLTHKGGVKQ